jgi:hypothetical protein
MSILYRYRHHQLPHGRSSVGVYSRGRPDSPAHVSPDNHSAGADRQERRKGGFFRGLPSLSRAVACQGEARNAPAGEANQPSLVSGRYARRPLIIFGSED